MEPIQEINSIKNQNLVKNDFELDGLQEPLMKASQVDQTRFNQLISKPSDTSSSSAVSEINSVLKNYKTAGSKVSAAENSPFFKEAIESNPLLGVSYEMSKNIRQLDIASAHVHAAMTITSGLIKPLDTLMKT